jgi:Zn-dependent peptidase ImmA (M78 family)
VRLPPLPSAVPSPLGPVAVVLCPKIKRGKDSRFVFGKYNTALREIHISQKASHVMQWQTLFHEWAHMVLRDAGLQNLLTSDQEEVFCEALGTARTHELIEWCRKP